LVDAADENPKPEALAKLAALPQIKLFAVDNRKLNGTAVTYSINKNNALELSAETCANLNQTESAIAFRQKLLEIAPEDANNKIELARLYARNNNKNATVKLLAEVINNRNADVNSRWQAVWISREIVENKADLLNATQSAESELRNALEIFTKNQIEIKIENPSSQFWFFLGVVAKSFNHNDFALNAFQNSLIADNELQNPFGEENAAQQLMRLYIAKNQANAAFKLADADKSAKSDELLNLLSETAGRVGDFTKAIEFEKAKSKDIDKEKIARLENLEKEKLQKATDFAVNLENTRRF
ncbi:MAG: hypothetical protein ABI686_12555, partial [Acidobacteriota bacterium]